MRIADEFPRSSYQIITKAGRYGRTKETGFDYSPERIRSSIANSLKLMNTTYLDGVYMHDVEFVGCQIGGAGEEGFTVDEGGSIRSEDLERWGLGKGMEGEIRSEGDQKVLDAMATLFEMRKEGTIHAVGFSGAPLHLLLSYIEANASLLRLSLTDSVTVGSTRQVSLTAPRHNAILLSPHVAKYYALHFSTVIPRSWCQASHYGIPIKVRLFQSL